VRRPSPISLVILAVVAALLIVNGSNRMAGAVNHRWQGTRTSFTAPFHIPAGPLPLIARRPWTLHFHYACPKLRVPRGMPPNTMRQSVLRIDLGGFVGESTRTFDTHVVSFDDGGSYTLHLQIHRDCRWKVWTAS